MIDYDERYKDYPSRIEGILLEGFGAMGDTPTISGGSITGGKVIGEEDGDIIISGELRVDTADDLPAKDSIEGYILRNCIALVVHTGDIWAQDSADEWYNQTNPTSSAPEAPAAASTLNLSPTALEKSVIKPENTADTLSKSGNADVFDEPTEELPETTEETVENDDFSEPARSDADGSDI
jgi:hypothetical protein